MLSNHLSSCNLNQNTPGVKNKQPRTKKTLLKRHEIEMGGQGLLFLIGLKILIIMTSLDNIVILGAQGLLMLMGSKFLIKMSRPQLMSMGSKFLIKVTRPQNVVAWSSLSKILIPSTSGDLN